MAFTMKIDLSDAERQMMSDFGDGGKAQRIWSELVFNGSIPYMPMVTGTFRNLSIIASTPLFAHGELLYPGPFAHYLWEGKLYVDPETGSAYARRGVTKMSTETTLSFNAEANPNACARWVERAANDHKNEWIEAFQKIIDRGLI